MESLASPARFEQLCNVEAIEQIASQGSGFRPERVVAYATADTSLEGDELVAEGAAFLSGGVWRHLSFRCATTPDHRKVVSFDFATGGLIPDGPELGSGEAD
jgi:hypothetical protein